MKLSHFNENYVAGRARPEGRAAQGGLRACGMRTIIASGSDPEYAGRISSSRRLEEVEGGECKTQPGGGKPHQRKLGCMETSGSSGADPGIYTPGRPSGGEGGALRREGRDRIEAIRNLDSHDPNGLLGETGESLGGYEDGSKPGHRPAETAGATGSGSVKLQGVSDPLQAVFSG
jgi:hypothetical protein